MTDKKNTNNSGRFKKGNPGGGRKPLPPEIKELSNHTKPAIIKAYHTISTLSLSGIATFQPANLIEQGILKCLLEFGATGKTDQIRHIWAECHGKPKESIDIAAPEGITINLDRQDSNL